jgi:ABC-type cobalamin/Fe3+-siderophores transport system ATPase subunit
VIARDGSNIGLSTLPSGEKHLVRLLIESLRAGPSSLIIDEPEISLHIEWQQQLVEIIRNINPNCQLASPRRSGDTGHVVACERTTFVYIL